MKKIIALVLVLALSQSFGFAARAESIVPAMPTEDIYPAALVDAIFETLSGHAFLYMSGAGGWSTDMEMLENGYFTGYFHDSDMGDIGEDYPEGTLYTCNFSGRFILDEVVDEYTYKLRLAELKLDEERGTEQITDGVKIVSTDAHGIAGGEIFMLYYKGRETADLPGDFLDWVKMPNAWEEIPETLPCYGLYNVSGLEGFFSFDSEADEADTSSLTH